MRLLRTGVVIATACATSAAMLAAPADAAVGKRVTVTHARPSWAHAKPTGTPSAGKRVNLTVTLGWRHTSRLESFIKRVSTPGSAGYRHFVSPATFRARYAPTRSDVAKVEHFLRSAGLRIGTVPSNHSYVEASGTVAQAEKAFHTKLRLYKHGKRTDRAPAKAVTVPHSVSSLISGIGGLSTAAHQMKPLKIAPPAGYRVGKPCSAYFGQKKDTTTPMVPGYAGSKTYIPCGYDAAQLQGAYGTSKLIRQGINGSGATVAIVDAYYSDTLYADAARNARDHGTAPLRRSQYSETILPPNKALEGNDQCGATGWRVEQSLDVEAVHSMAPGANIRYVGASSCQDLDLAKAVDRIVNRRSADIITNSYGSRGTETPDPAWVADLNHLIFLQAAAEGISVLFSSGDDGDSSGDTADGRPTVTDPANDPLVTAVGGTTLGVGQHDQRLFETGWQGGAIPLQGGAWQGAYPGTWGSGGGGGTSRVWNEPWYQRGVVPNALATKWGGHGRVVPDVAMLGDPETGLRTGYTQVFPDGTYYDENRYGGTSLSSPLLAGELAVAVQLDHHPLGFINPALYRMNGGKALHDIAPSATQRGVTRTDWVNSVDASKGITTAFRSFDDEAQSLHLRPGYDNITGVGSPRGTAFLRAVGRWF